MNRVFSYFIEARDELRKVAWPTRQQAVNEAMVVIAITVVMAAFLGIIDIVLGLGLEKILFS